MTENHFSIKEAFNLGWEGWKKNWFLFALILLIALFITFLPDIIVGFFPNAMVNPSNLTSILIQVVQFLIGSLVALGITNVALQIAKGLKATFSDFFNISSYYLSYIGATLLYYIVTSLGLILLIIPGIILSLMFYLYAYYVLDKDMGPIEAFKASRRAIYGSKWKLFGFLILATLLNILGLLCLGVGLLVTIPIVAIASAVIYLMLDRQTNGISKEGY